MSVRDREVDDETRANLQAAFQQWEQSRQDVNDAKTARDAAICVAVDEYGPRKVAAIIGMTEQHVSRLCTNGGGD